MKARYGIIFCVISYCLIITGLAGCQNQPLYKDTRLVMGTFIEVVSADPRAAEIVFAEMTRIEKLLSKYDPKSEISKLNKFGEFKVNPETFYLIKKAKDIWKLTNGAFDISIAPLMDLWGFTDKECVIPAQEQIKDTLKLVGSDKIILNEADNVIKFMLSGMKIDLGAIAKGYAVDCASRELQKQGIKNCLINAGGDIYCLGDKYGRPWKVAIQHPRQEGFTKYLKLSNKAIATSGDYEQYFTQRQKRYSHIFDPRTGYPADAGVTAVTVLAGDCLTADALATAIFVLGKEKGKELLQDFTGAEAIIENEKQ